MRLCLDLSTTLADARFGRDDGESVIIYPCYSERSEESQPLIFCYHYERSREIFLITRLSYESAAGNFERFARRMI